MLRNSRVVVFVPLHFIKSLIGLPGCNGWQRNLLHVNKWLLYWGYYFWLWSFLDDTFWHSHVLYIDRGSGNTLYIARGSGNTLYIDRGSVNTLHIDRGSVNTYIDRGSVNTLYIDWGSVNTLYIDRGSVNTLYIFIVRNYLMYFTVIYLQTI
jgi:hypothetical protein